MIHSKGDILKRGSGLTPGQDDVSERNEVNDKGGHTQWHDGQPAEKRHSPIESTGKRHKSSVSFFAVFTFDVYIRLPDCASQAGILLIFCVV